MAPVVEDRKGRGNADRRRAYFTSSGSLNANDVLEDDWGVGAGAVDGHEEYKQPAFLAGFPTAHDMRRRVRLGGVS
jgi:hypothetical protein